MEKMQDGKRDAGNKGISQLNQDQPNYSFERL